MREGIKKRSILIVEDDAAIRAMLCRLFDEEGYTVSSAPNGKVALSLLQTQKYPDLILLDLLMPVMNATEFRKIQEMDSNIANIPILVMSGDGDIVIKSLEIGLNRFVKKPIDIDDLLATVEKIYQLPSLSSF